MINNNKDTYKKKYYTSKVLDNLISQKRIPLLFIGSGISKRYLQDYPTWDELLANIASCIGISKSQLIAMKQEITDNNRNASIGKINQAIGEQLTNIFRKKVIDNEIDLTTIFSEKEIEQINKKNISFVKMLIAKQLSNYKITDRQYYINEINELKKLQYSIGAVVTTNYDTFLENEIFPGFSVFVDQSQYYMSDSVGIGEIYKIHGSTTYPESIIFNESDYANFESNLRGVAAKLLTLAMDYPIIFIGYSLEDEDILNILNTLIDCLSKEQLANLSQNIIYVNWKEREHRLFEQKKVVTNNGKSLHMTCINTDNFYVLYKYIQKFMPTEKPERIRKYKKMIRSLISQSNAGEKTIICAEQNLNDLKASNNLAIAFGEKEALSDKGLVGIGIDDILRDVFNQRPYTPNSANNLVSKAYIKNSHFTKTQFVPIFYHIKQCDNLDLLKDQKVSALFDNCAKNESLFLKENNTTYNITELNATLKKEPVVMYKFLKSVISSYIAKKITYDDYINLLKKIYSAGKLKPNDESTLKKAITLADYIIIKEKMPR